MQAIADVTGLHAVSLFRILRGKSKVVWKSTEEKVLALDRDAVFRMRETLMPDNANVPTAPVKKMMGLLKRHGFSRREVVKRLGLASDLRMDRPTMKAWRAMKVEQFYNLATAEA